MFTCETVHLLYDLREICEQINCTGRLSVTVETSAVETFKVPQNNREVREKMLHFVDGVHFINGVEVPPKRKKTVSIKSRTYHRRSKFY